MSQFGRRLDREILVGVFSDFTNRWHSSTTIGIDAKQTLRS
jgi:hypothetical protein